MPDDATIVVLRSEAAEAPTAKREAPQNNRTARPRCSPRPGNRRGLRAGLWDGGRCLRCFRSR
jgi:hypothetical protein